MELIFTLMAVPFVALGLLTAAILWGFASVNSNSWGQATLTTLLGAFALSFMFGIDFTYIKAHIGDAMVAFGAYLVIGVVWSFAKWFSTLRRVADKLIEDKEKFIATRNKRVSMDFLEAPLNEDGPDPRQEFAKYLGYQFTGVAAVGITKQDIIENVRPKAAQNKSNITGWIAFWPLSAVWTLIDDPVRRLIDYIFARFKNLYELMSKSVFKGI